MREGSTAVEHTVLVVKLKKDVTSHQIVFRKLTASTACAALALTASRMATKQARTVEVAVQDVSLESSAITMMIVRRVLGA